MPRLPLSLTVDAAAGKGGPSTCGRPPAVPGFPLPGRVFETGQANKVQRSAILDLMS